jgi:hypothetical protein
MEKRTPDKKHYWQQRANIMAHRRAGLKFGIIH